MHVSAFNILLKGCSHIGRFALAISDSQGVLPIILGAPDRWRDAHRSLAAETFAESRKKLKAASAKSDFGTLQQQFRCRHPLCSSMGKTLQTIIDSSQQM